MTRTRMEVMGERLKESAGKGWKGRQAMGLWEGGG